ncbi:cation diffusion facilitator family transporter [Priestia megaterium]|uniref:cation diffusion facilitator family transporter n=1 Tax=Priestia megaterium TaxID=1404 RepID=UPI0028775B3E|nr:cation diffusion facilitator family transporter [Priestia megaterium]MBX4163988.1 cation diffusion facilitator family transporter [Priestia megaterium]
MENYYEQAQKGAWVSILSYIFLSACKLTIAGVTASFALKADGLNNVTDIIASIAVLIGLKISKKPRDNDHPYGHSRAEHISSLIASFIMMVIGLEVLVDAGQSLFMDKSEAPNLLAAWVGLGAAAVMGGVYRYNIKLAKKLDSQSLYAVAKDNLSDALVSIGAVVGIFGSQFGLPWLDVVAAFAVGIIICKTAIEIFKEAAHSLTDGFDEEKLGHYKESIGLVKGVKEVEDVKARKLGNQVVIDVTVKVDPHLNVIKSHEIADQIEHMMNDEHQIKDTLVHIEPDAYEKQK